MPQAEPTATPGQQDPSDPEVLWTGQAPPRLRVDARDEVRTIMPFAEHRLLERAARLAGEAGRPAPELPALEDELRVTVERDRFITRSSTFHTIGSCFAVNVRRVLRERGMAVHPRSDEIQLDEGRQFIGQRRVLNHYDTFTIRQELERVLEPGSPGYGPIPARRTKPGTSIYPLGDFWQDPTRMCVFATDEVAANDLVAKIDASTAASIESADVFVISLGLIESWVDTVTGRHAWGHGATQIADEPDRFAFHLSTYEENLANVRWICAALGSARPDARIVLTVSPVGLGRTFSGADVMVANTYSKSMLRTVAGAVTLEDDRVTYWPSYEIATKGNLFDRDQCHVTRDGVAYIIDRFLSVHGDL